MKEDKKYEFFGDIINDRLNDLTFVLDLSAGNNQYTGLSKFSLDKVNYSIGSFAQKIKAIYKENHNDSLDIQKGDISSLSNSIPNVDRVSNDLSRNRGVFKENGITYYNHWNPSPMMIKIEKNNKGKDKKNYSECFNWFNYSHINFLLNHLLNIEENQAYNSNKELIDLKYYFLNWMAACLQENKKTGTSIVFISPMHGTGKNVFSNIFKDYYGKDYYADVNNDTFTGVHNAIIDNKLFVFFNESEINHQDYEKVSSKLKIMIADEDVTVRKMREDQVNKKSYFNMIINSNNTVPFKIEHNDRRFTVIKNKMISLKQAVSDNLGMDVQDFVNEVRKETLAFLSDLLLLNVDRKLSDFNALMTDAKKLIVKATNTQVNNVVDLINKCDVQGLREYFFDSENEHMLEEFISQVQSRFLTNEVVNNFLHVNLREFEKDAKSSKLSKKQFWDKRLGEAKIALYTKPDGSKTSVMVRRLAGFNTKNVDTYFGKIHDTGFESLLDKDQEEWN